MEDSGVTSFSSSGSVDISLDALDLSSSNPPNDDSAASCNESLELSTTTAAARNLEETGVDLTHSATSAVKVDVALDSSLAAAPGEELQR